MDENTYGFGYWLRRQRKALDLTQAELASRVGCSITTIKKIEREERRPSSQIAELLARELKVPTETRHLFTNAARRLISADNLPQPAQPITIDPVSCPALPIPKTPFVGREQEIEVIESWLSKQECRLVCLVGSGGMGKSRIAIEVAKSMGASFQDGVAWISVVETFKEMNLAEIILNQFCMNWSPKVQTDQQLFTYFQDKEMLLVIDSYEHLLPDVSLINGFVQRAPRIKLLITSRERLHLSSEWVMSVDGMPYPPAGFIFKYTEVLSSSEKFPSVELFINTAKRIHRRFQVDDESLKTIGHICRRLGGMPLAIELAAAWTTILDVNGIAQQIENGLDLLEADLQDLPEKHRSIRSVFNSSWKLLTSREQTDIQKLAVFCDGFRQESTESVFGIPKRTLLRLVNRGWLQPEQKGRIRMHELTRQYALECMAGDPHLKHNSEMNHSEYFCRFLQERDDGWIGPRQGDVFFEIGKEILNIEEAYKWALDNDRLDLVSQAVESLCFYYSRSGRLGEGESTSRAAAERLERKILEGGGQENNLLARARALAWQGWFTRDTQAARDLLKMAGSLLGELDHNGVDVRLDRARLMLWEERRLDLSDPHRSWELLEKSATLYQELGLEGRQAEVLSLWGFLALIFGRFDEAVQILKKGFDINHRSGNHYGEVYSLIYQSFVYIEQGKLSEAEKCAQTGLSLAESLRMSYLERQILPVLAQVLLYTGRFPEAQDLAQKSLDIHARVGESHEYVLYTLALACEHQRDYIPARSLIEQSLLEARRLNSWYHISFALDCSAEISMAEQRFEEASHQLQESLEILSNRKAPVMMGIPLANLAYTMRALGHTEKANYYLRKSLELAYRIGSFKQALHALPYLALSYGDRGNIQQAIQIFALAKKYPYVANSKWFEDIAGREIRSWEHALVENRSGKSEKIEQEIRIWDIVRQWLELEENKENL